MNSIFISSFFFVLATIVTFFFPGYFVVFLTRASLSYLERVVLSFVVGITVFAGLSFLLGIFHILPFVPIIVLTLSMMGTILYFQYAVRIQLRRNHLLFLLVIVLGVGVQLIPMVRNGMLTEGGMSFWGPHGYDAIFHFSLIEQLQKAVPPQNPIFAGTPFLNYHYFSDLVIASFSTIWQLEIADLYFRFFPALLSVLLGFSMFVVARRFVKSEVSAMLAVVLSYVGGSFGYIVTLMKDQGVGGESMFWSMQSISYLVNPPYAFSVIILLGGVLGAIVAVKQKNNGMIFLASFLFGILVGFKVYAAVIAIASLGIAAGVSWLWKQHEIPLKLLILSATISFAFASFFLSLSERFLVFRPLWFLYNLPVQDRFGWFKAEQALFAYQQEGNFPKLFALLGILGTLFFIGNLGIRTVGAWTFFQWTRKRYKEFQFLFLLVLIVISAVFPLLFIQKGTSWNTIQFFYYFLLFSNIFAAEFVWTLIKKRHVFLKVCVIALFFLFAVPTTISSARMYMEKVPHSVLPLSEFAALRVLRDQPEGAVLAAPLMTMEAPSPVPLVFKDAAYVSAFSGKPVYFEDLNSNTIQARPIQFRQFVRKKIFEGTDAQEVSQFLMLSGVSYVYVHPFATFSIDPASLPLELLFEENGVSVYRVI